MRRRALLATVPAALAGCLGTFGDTTTDTDGTPDGTDAGTPSGTPYPDETVPFPDGPKDRPERPSDLTAESAAAFVERHEYRYSYNELWGPDVTVGMSEASCGATETESRQDGFLVTVRCSGYVNEPADGDGTATVHSDLPPWTVRYYVDDDSLLRWEDEDT